MMKILAIDTATKGASVAILNDDLLVSEKVIEPGMGHSSTLVPAIDALLKISGLTLRDIDAYVTTHGPGSFMGLRIGMGTVKGFCIADDKPYVGVSTLATIAMGAVDKSAVVAVSIDARKDEVYAAAYKFQNGLPVAVIHEGLMTGEEFKALISKEADVTMLEDVPPRAYHAGVLGFARLLRGERDDIRIVAPHYLKKTDAERKKDVRS